MAYTNGNPGHIRTAGIDEVGRGALAGAVVAVAVVLDPRAPVSGLKDSKALSARRRLLLAGEIRQKALAWGLGRAEVEEIDSINILQASLLAMRRAVDALPFSVDHAWVDGNQKPDLPCPTDCLVGGDARLESIMAASILAKVARDQEMLELDAFFPGYGFTSNKGYGTPAHLAALRANGPCPLHRRSFAPVRRAYDNSRC